jgi:hypothetical protein
MARQIFKGLHNFLLSGDVGVQNKNERNEMRCGTTFRGFGT